MEREQIIHMAREAHKALVTQDYPGHMGQLDPWTIRLLERFAALAIKPWADQLEVERKRFQELNDVAALGMQHARADEREACAELCERMARRTEDIRRAALEVAAENIRARGQA